jgi:hypothetical protein
LNDEGEKGAENSDHYQAKKSQGKSAYKGLYMEQQAFFINHDCVL